MAEEFGADAAQLTQLLIEYDPQPPFNVDSLDKAPSAIASEACEAFAKFQAGDTLPDQLDRIGIEIRDRFVL